MRPEKWHPGLSRKILRLAQKNFFEPWRTFIKLLHPVIAVLRQAGIRLKSYLDNILVMGRNRAEALRATATLLHHLYGLGFIVNLKKSQLLPPRVLVYLGFEVDSERMVLRVHRNASTRSSGAARHCWRLTRRLWWSWRVLLARWCHVGQA